MTRVRPRTIGAVYLATWAAISWLTLPALDSYGDMVENYAWSQTWSWGTFRHPPLFAWIVGAWFTVFPTRPWAYYLLSYVNAGVGIMGIVQLARLWLPDDLSVGRREAFVTIAALLALVSLPYSNLAAKFNADTVLLSLWPWTAYAFFAGLRAVGNWQRARLTALFALVAAAAMLGKYYSGLLLVSLLIISLSHPVFRRWYRTVYPYAALLLFVLLLVPHASWEARAGFPFREYIESKVDEGISLGRIVLFLLSGIYYLPAPWMAWGVLRSRFATAPPQPVDWALPLRGLTLLCVLPATLTTAFNVAARVHLTTHWAIPVWFALPVLMTVWLLPGISDTFAWDRFRAGLFKWWIALIAGGLAYTVVLATTGDPKYSLARQQMVETIADRFAQRFPGQQLAWAGGSWPEVGALAFFGSGHPRAVPGFPDQRRALVNPFPSWQQTYGVLLCYSAGTYAREGTRDEECERQTREWLRGHDRPIEEETLRYHAEGWRFVRAEPKTVTVFWIAP